MSTRQRTNKSEFKKDLDLEFIEGSAAVEAKAKMR